jgi:hypothetical protein
MATDSRYMTGLFNDRESPERAYQGAINRGYSKDDVNLLISEHTGNRHVGTTAGKETERGNKVAAGTSIAIPGLGLVDALMGLKTRSAVAGAVQLLLMQLLEVMGWHFLRQPLQKLVARRSGLPCTLAGGFKLGLLGPPRPDAGHLRLDAP